MKPWKIWLGMLVPATVLYAAITWFAFDILAVIAANTQQPHPAQDRFLIQTYYDGASGLTLHVVQEHRGEGCWVFAESSRGLAVQETGLEVCYPNEEQK